VTVAAAAEAAPLGCTQAVASKIAKLWHDAAHHARLLAASWTPLGADAADCWVAQLASCWMTARRSIVQMVYSGCCRHYCCGVCCSRQAYVLPHFASLSLLQAHPIQAQDSSPGQRTTPSDASVQRCASTDSHGPSSVFEGLVAHYCQFLLIPAAHTTGPDVRLSNCFPARKVSFLPVPA
jgi:hypothetical protein